MEHIDVEVTLQQVSRPIDFVYGEGGSSSREIQAAGESSVKSSEKLVRTLTQDKEESKQKRQQKALDNSGILWHAI